MRWLFFCALLFIFPIFAKHNEDTSRIPCSKCDELEGQPDLFKRYDQIYSGWAEFLYWTVAEGGLDYALKMQHDAWGPTPSYAQGRYETASYDLDPGFRVGLLYFRAPHFWEIRWQYTRMTLSGENESRKPDADQQFLTGTWPQILTAPLMEARSHIHLNYNVFDWYIDRVFFPNPHLRLRVMGGASAAWMDQDWKVTYQDSAPNFTTIRNRWHYVGGGLKTGTMFDWYWTGDLYMTAQGFFGLFIGNYSNHAEQTTTAQVNPADNTTVPVRDAFYKDVRPAISAQMLLGPSYQKNYPCHRLEIFAGFEMNAWFNVQEVYRSTASTASFAKETWVTSSVLALYGLTTRVSLDF